MSQRQSGNGNRQKNLSVLGLVWTTATEPLSFPRRGMVVQMKYEGGNVKRERETRGGYNSHSPPRPKPNRCSTPAPKHVRGSRSHQARKDGGIGGTESRDPKYP